MVSKCSLLRIERSEFEPQSGQCIVFLGKILYFQCLWISIQVYKWVRTNLVQQVALQWTPSTSRGEKEFIQWLYTSYRAHTRALCTIGSHSGIVIIVLIKLMAFPPTTFIYITTIDVHGLKILFRESTLLICFYTNRQSRT